MKKQLITYFKNLPKNIIFGFTDALLPHIKESVKEKDTDFFKETPKLEINYTRLTSALVFFTLNILAIFDFITFQDILKFLEQWNLLLQ